MSDEKKPTINQLYQEYRIGCKEDNWPDFAPEYCYRCGKSPFAEMTTLEQARKARITGCRNCCVSYCD